MSALAQRPKSELEVERLANQLEKATTVDEIKDVRDRAMAIQLYTRKKEGGLRAAQAAGRIVTDAMMKLAALYAEESTSRGRGGLDRKDGLARKQDHLPGKAAVANAAGLDSSTLSRLGPIASLKKRDAEPLMRAIEERGEIVSPAALMREAKEQGVIVAPEPKSRAVDHLRGRDARDFQAATHGLGMVRRFAAESGDHDIDAIARGSDAAERKDAIRDCRVATQWLERLRMKLEKANDK